MTDKEKRKKRSDKDLTENTYSGIVGGAGEEKKEE